MKAHLEELEKKYNRLRELLRVGLFVRGVQTPANITDNKLVGRIFNNLVDGVEEGEDSNGKTL